MSYLSINNVRIAGISACVPENVEENFNLSIFKDELEAKNVITSTGIERKHVVMPGTLASDLSIPAVEKLLKELNWAKSSIDLLVFCSLARDYIAPQTSCILQDRLSLSTNTCVFDLPIGCAGYVQGMSMVSSMISHGGMKRALFICAETNSINRSKKDKTVRPLFGDAATVTALEYSHEAKKPFNFVFGTDGSGCKAIWTPAGGMRNPVTEEDLKEIEVEPGVIRRSVDMAVNGMDVFGFAIKRPPKAIKDLMMKYNIDVQTLDYLFLHQANKYIDEKIRKSLEIPSEKVPYCLEDYGNVTSASIPLTVVTCCQKNVVSKANHCIAAGFGIGFEWACMEFDLTNIVCPSVINI